MRTQLATKGRGDNLQSRRSVEGEEVAVQGIAHLVGIFTAFVKFKTSPLQPF